MRSGLCLDGTDLRAKESDSLGKGFRTKRVLQVFVYIQGDWIIQGKRRGIIEIGWVYKRKGDMVR